MEGLRLMERLFGRKGGESDYAGRDAQEAESAGTGPAIAAAKRKPAPAGIEITRGGLSGSGGEDPAGRQVREDRDLPKPVEQVPRPPFWGSRVPRDIDLDKIWPFLNRSALFCGDWGFRKGKLSAQEYAELERDTLLPHYERLKREAREEGWLEAAAIHGYYPVNSEDRRLLVYEGPEDEEPRWEFEFPRARRSPGRCIADFFLPRSSGRRDLLCLQVVTMGARAAEYASGLKTADRYQEYLFVHGLGVSAAEALAEYIHHLIRGELGIDGAEPEDADLAPVSDYRGCRYSFGYPACPDLEDQVLLCEILGARRIGLQLTEELQLVPQQSTSALVVHHPDADYFTV